MCEAWQKLTAMKPFSFKMTSDHFLLCVSLSLLWVATDSTSSVDSLGTNSTNRTTPTTSTTPITTPTTSPTTTTTLPTTKAPPGDVHNLTVSTRSETSITLQWKKVGNILEYKLDVNGALINFPASGKTEYMNHTISNLTCGTRNNFTLFTVLENVTSSGVKYTAPTAPCNAEGLKSVGQSETSITLQWKKVGNILEYKLDVNGALINFPASGEKEDVNHTISNLTCGTRNNFTLFTVFENVTSSGVKYTAPTVPCPVTSVEVTERSATSVTLQWQTGNPDWSYYVRVNDGHHVFLNPTKEQVSYSIPSVTPGTLYNFTVTTTFCGLNSTLYEDFTVTALHCTWNVTSSSIQGTIGGLFSNATATNGTQLHISPKGASVRFDGLWPGATYLVSLVYERASRSFSQCLENVTILPGNVHNVTVSTRNETSITLQWEKVDNISTYFLHYNESISKKVNDTNGGSSVVDVVTGLCAGKKYNFTITTTSGGLNSTGYSFQAVTAPRNAEGLKSVDPSETSITLQWKKVGNILEYKLDVNGKLINVSASGEKEDVNHTISNLTCGTRNNFTLFTVLENVTSSGVKYTAPTAPCNAEGLKSVGQSETSITLRWKKVGNVLEYKLDVNGALINFPASGEKEDVNHTISNLTCGTRNNFTLFTVFDNVTSSGVKYTAPTVPCPVTSVEVTERSATSVTLQWQTGNPDWSYYVRVNDGHHVFLNPTKEQVSYSIPSVTPGTLYNFTVTTTFCGLNSTLYEDFTVTALHCTWNVTSSSIQGTIGGLFSNATATNGTQLHISPKGASVRFDGLWPGATYLVSLVYERASRSFSQCLENVTILPSHLTARCEYFGRGYSVSVVWREPLGVWTSVEVNVSGFTHSVLPNQEQHLQISGFLPARRYEVSLYSKSGQQSSGEPFVFSCLTDPRGVIAGAVFGVLIFCLLVFLAVFILYKRPDILRKKTFIGGTRESIKKMKAIPVAKFPEHFYKLSMDQGRGFSEEYESLSSVGVEQTKEAALLPQNKPRNRFTNILPYDWCRVKLSTLNPNEASDYINACYMPGYKSDRDYIATQGPLPATVKDFWRMIWEQRVTGIVMVTNCSEGGRTKCEQYWPADRKPCPHGDLSVRIRSEEKEPNWTLREFRVKHRHHSEERMVRHFHFTAWPDHGVPQGTGVLIQFRGLVRQHIEREGATAPTVVHCSAGVGRTGTIIALDVLLQQLERERAVGINGFVRKMRLSRPHMVQTESQYVFLHQCIMDRLQQDEEPEEHIYENADMIYTNGTALRELTRA